MAVGFIFIRVKIVIFARVDLTAYKMNTKLTLTIERDVIDKAKKYANTKGQTLSDIIENYLKVITNEEPIDDIQLTPIVKSLKGSFKVSDKFDYKKELTKALTEKYL